MNDIADTPLARNVRAARERLSLTQQELADLAGVSQTTIDKIERGLTKRSRFINFIASALQTSAHDLDNTVPVDFLRKDRENVRDILNAQDGNIPLYASEPEMVAMSDGTPTDTGMFSIGRLPLHKVPHTPLLVPTNNSAYAIYVSNHFMRPEISEGDVVIVDPRRPAIPGVTCVFGVPDDQLRVIGILLSDDDGSPDQLRVALHKLDRPLLLRKKDWTIIHRIVAKFYRA